jgi:hypothetical protein
LTVIELNAFSRCCSLTSITIPRHVQIICLSSFSNGRSVSSISFETTSELTHIK